MDNLQQQFNILQRTTKIILAKGKVLPPILCYIFFLYADERVNF